MPKPDLEKRRFLWNLSVFGKKSMFDLIELNWIISFGMIFVDPVLNQINDGFQGSTSK